MLSQREHVRYQRQLILPEIGEAGQLKLRSAKVLVIGAGGLGCPALQYMAAAGVGTIGIADGDTVDESNLQRQILYSSSDVGKQKALVAKERIQQLNPFIKVEAYVDYIDVENALEIIKAYDVVVDGSDNFATRYLINDACVMLNKPLVFGSIFKFEGQVSVFNYNDGPTYRCLFPEPPGSEESPDCATIGVIASLPGIIGTLQANETIKIITQHGDVLSGRLLTLDAASMHMQMFQFSVNAINKKIDKLSQPVVACSLETEITYERVKEMLKDSFVQLIDVRDVGEHQIRNIGGINIPLSELKYDYQQLDPATTTIVYCASGKRSKIALEFLMDNGFRDVYSLQNGLRAV